MAPSPGGRGLEKYQGLLLEWRDCLLLSGCVHVQGAWWRGRAGQGSFCNSRESDLNISSNCL